VCGKRGRKLFICLFGVLETDFGQIRVASELQTDLFGTGHIRRARRLESPKRLVRFEVPPALH
jgi:hypothetical protein